MAINVSLERPSTETQGPKEIKTKKHMRNAWVGASRRSIGPALDHLERRNHARREWQVRKIGSLLGRKARNRPAVLGGSRAVRVGQLPSTTKTIMFVGTL